MESLLDRGDSYRVEYLGSAMLTTMATGLGLVQKPLRELYFRHKQAGKESKLQPRHLTMTGRGMSMSFQNGGPHTQPQEVFYAVPSILFWDAVQFVAVRGPDKKVRCAFEPLDNDHSRNKDKIFTALEKKYHFLQQMKHPALFTCVLRRTSGVKALDLYAFVCSSEDEALGLVRALNMVQANYTEDEVSETSVFGYNPFGKDSVRSTAGSNRGGLLHVTGGADNRHRLYGSTPSLDAIGAPQSRASIAVPPGHGVALPGIAQRTQADLQPGRGLALPPQQPATRSKSYLQLTQEDFTPSPTNSLGSSNRRASPVDDPDHTYQYLGHIDKSLERRQEAARQAEQPPPGRGRGTPSEVSRKPSVYTSRDRDGRQEYNAHEDIGHSAATGPSGQSAYLGRSWERGGTGGPKTGQGYSLLSGSGGAPPGYHGPKPRAQPPSESYSAHDTPPPPGGARHREGSPTGYQHTITRNQSRAHQREEEPPADYGSHWSGPTSPSHAQHISPREPQASTSGAAQPPLQLPPRNPVPVSRASSRRDAPPLASSHLPPSDPPPHHSGQDTADPSALYAKPKPKNNPPTPGSSSARSMFGSSDSQTDTPNRPVAKVPPHKVQGVKVLPSVPLAKPPNDRFLERTPQPKPLSQSSQNKPEPHLVFPLKKTQPSASSAAPGKDSGKGKGSAKAPNNWQFNAPAAQASDQYKTVKPEEMAKGGDGTMNEKLLMSQKKDAEIASVMHNIHLDYEANTLSPHGTNFESALGYFP